MSTRAKTLVKKLSELRLRYTAETASEKAALLKTLSKVDFKTASTKLETLLEYHEILLFLSAFPASPGLTQLAGRELSRLNKEIERLAQSKPRIAAAIENTGVCGSITNAPLSLSASAWILANFPRATSLSLINDKSEEEWGTLLRECSWLPLADAVLHEDLSTAEVTSLSSTAVRSPTWLGELFAHDSFAEVFATALFEKRSPAVSWRLNPTEARSGLKIPTTLLPKSPFYHQELRKGAEGLKSLIRTRLPAPRKLSSKHKQQLVHLSRTALYSRGRETDPISYTSESDVTLFSLESGIDVILLGSNPTRRRPLETFVGYLAAKNGYPIAYGGAWMLGPQADIGVNIFDTFRGGESAYLFAQIIRVYHRHFGIEAFEVEPYQFGKDNEEAIDSGAFWFYWRLGFEPTQKDLKKLATREWSQISTAREYRTSKATLRKLAQGRVRLQLTEKQRKTAGANSRIAVYSCAVSVLDFIGKKHQGNWAHAYADSQAKLCGWLGIRSLHTWSDEQRAALRSLALYFAQFPEIKRWPVSEKTRLTELIRAKGQAAERPYQMLLLRSEPIRKLLTKLSEHGDRVARRTSAKGRG